MAERKSQNKWIPNDFDPKQFRTINKYVKFKRNPMAGRHIEEEETDIFESLKDRPVDSFHRTITVRFEMPYNIWCTGCEKHIGMGVRYNAEKFHVGMYFTTPVFKFRFKCHLCPSYIEIETDPKNAEYKIVAGARKRIESYDPKDIGVIELADEVETKKLEEDSFFRLEHGIGDVKQSESAAPKIQQIIAFNNLYRKDPYTSSQQVRQKFRKEKEEEKVIQDESRAVQDRLGLSIPVLPASAKDGLQAKSINWKEKTLDVQPSLATLSSIKSIFRTSKNVSSNRTNTAKEKLLKLVLKHKKGDPFKKF